MTNMIDLDRVRSEAALKGWAKECKDRMGTRWPRIAFDDKHWPLRSLYQTKFGDISFEPLLADFQGKDPAYFMALQCLLAEAALKGDVKVTEPTSSSWRLLVRLDTPLSDLKRVHLTQLEEMLVEEAQSNPASAATYIIRLCMLMKQVDRLAQRGVIDRLAWSIGHDTRRTLNILLKQRRSNLRASKAEVLDRQIAALSDAMRAALSNDSRLTTYDQACLAAIGINMCAPSRINEPLCMSIDDRFTIEDYAARADGKNDDALHRTHQLLLVKGSKGADWGAKPILNFMISLVDRCFEVIKQHSQRSRKLVQWYENHPNQLYLPPELEHLRGQLIDREALWNILNLTVLKPTSLQVSAVGSIWSSLRKANLLEQIDNPRALTANGIKNPHPTIDAVAWSSLEPVLLERVRKAMDDVRRVTIHSHYQGRLSNMLFLFDSDTTPYLPGSIKYASLTHRLKQSPAAKKRTMPPTVFEKLDIKLVANGIVQYAWIDTHDPRRWLTTQAMMARERLSDVLINKWANRLDIGQLKHYDLRSSEQKSEQAAMPAINELLDMTAGLEAVAGIEEEYGLRKEIVTAHDAGISVTSMDAIVSATENRPIAKTSNQIIILYPSKYGACLHQHHETPCRAYNCLPCDNNLVVKGHIPTNDAVKHRNDQLHQSIVLQIDTLLTARQRQISDSPETLDSHILTLVREGLNAEEMVVELVERFHEIKDGIKDAWFRNMLEEAFVARGMVSRLDNATVASGALIKYHNPSCHAAPGHERAIDSVHGGRAAMQAQLEAFEREHTEFAPSALGLKDERHLLQAENEDEDNDETA